MSKQWVRQEIKRNEVAVAVDRSMSWFQQNRQTALAAGGATLAVLLLAGIVTARTLNRRTEAWEKLAIAESYAYQGNPAESISQLKTLADTYGLRDAGGFGLLFSADVLYRQGKPQEAAELYRRLVDSQRPKGMVPVALANLGLALEAAGDFKAAAEHDQRFLDTYGDHFLAPQTHASLARALAGLGQPDQAKAALDRIALLYPDTYWSSWAQARAKAPLLPLPPEPKAAPAVEKPAKAAP